MIGEFLVTIMKKKIVVGIFTFQIYAFKKTVNVTLWRLTCHTSDQFLRLLKLKLLSGFKVMRIKNINLLMHKFMLPH